MFRYIDRLINLFKQLGFSNVPQSHIENISDIALRKYKVALIDLFERSGPQRKKLILLRVSKGVIWSKLQFNKILTRHLLDYSEVSYRECATSLDYTSLRNEFTLWSKKYFLADSDGFGLKYLKRQKKFSYG